MLGFELIHVSKRGVMRVENCMYTGPGLGHCKARVCVLETNGAGPTAGTVMETKFSFFLNKIHIRRWDNF